MRYFYLTLTGILIVLMLVVFFQNYSIGQQQQLYFLTSARATNAANAMLYAYIFGAASMLSALLFLTGGRFDMSLPKAPSSKDDDEWA
jgi:glucose-6-phosphate-specific signal transduction histidine kinase